MFLLRINLWVCFHLLGSTVKVHGNHPDSTKPWKGSVYTINDPVRLHWELTHTKADMLYHLHLSWSLRDYPLNGSSTCPYVSSLSMRTAYVKRLVLIQQDKTWASFRKEEWKKRKGRKDGGKWQCSLYECVHACVWVCLHCGLTCFSKLL